MNKHCPLQLTEEKRRNLARQVFWACHCSLCGWSLDLKGYCNNYRGNCCNSGGDDYDAELDG